MAKSNKLEPQQPLLLRAHRLIEAFAKSDDERDFYLDRYEGFLLYIDLDKTDAELAALEKELTTNFERYCLIPKLTFYEAKKFMEGFVNEKIYDIDTKEKLLDIIQSKEARTNFLEFLQDHHAELEKWQQYYQERSRIRIIEWLRQNHFQFVFEEDLDIPRNLLEKLKQSIFETKLHKDLVSARKTLITKAKSYYSNEALNPRPKRGRPPKQIAKQEIEPQFSSDIYSSVPESVRPFLFTPDISTSPSMAFASDVNPTQARQEYSSSFPDSDLKTLNQKLAELRQISSKSIEKPTFDDIDEEEEDFDDFDEDEDEFDETINGKPIRSNNVKKSALPVRKTAQKSPKTKAKKAPSKSSPAKKTSKKSAPQKRKLRPIMKIRPKPSKTKSEKPKRIITSKIKRTKINPKPFVRMRKVKPLRKKMVAVKKKR